MTSVDNIQTKLKKYIDETETKIEAWEKVERLRKKDGGDFAALGKNFKNASVHPTPYRLIPTREIEVYGFTKFSGYVEDKIEDTGIVRYEKNRTVEENRIIKEPMLEAYYVKTVDEIFEDIEYRIKTLKGLKAKYEEDLAKSAEAFQKFKEKIDDALKELKQNADTSLYYLCRDYLKEAY